jgi:TetR/AcrR family transcriptional regulator
LGANVFYFLSAPMMRLIAGADPLEPKALDFRRRAAVEFLGQAIFMDREHGAVLAAQVLADTPMPQQIDPPTFQLQNVKIESPTINPVSSMTYEVRYK